MSRVYSSKQSVVFHKTKEAYGGLSNMAGGYPVVVNGIRIFTSEALYQACRFPDHPEVQKQILAEPSPMTAKDVSKQYNELTRPDWMTIRHRVMRWCLRVKLAQNMDSFGQLLISTAGKEIVELSYKDAYWGAIPSSADQLLLEGENVLGRLLMELRELLISGSEQLQQVPVLNVENFLLVGHPITEISSIGATDSLEAQRGLF
jgi:ribA/ribD-fused uncharacterized protein